MSPFIFWLLLILDLIGITLVILFHKSLLSFITDLCSSIREFMTKNSSIFTIAFLLLFFLEQLVLLVGVFLFNVSKKLQMLIGIFALIVITTATFEKFIWEYKYNDAKRKLGYVEQQNKEDLMRIKNYLVKLKKE